MREPKSSPIVQDSPRGTGDAVRFALAALREIDWLVVLYCDHPLLEPRRSQAPDGLRGSGARVAILTATVQDPGGYGRIARDERSSTCEDHRAARR